MMVPEHGGWNVFGLFKKKQPKPSANLDAAFEMGQKAGDAFMVDLEAFFDRRYGPVSDGYVKVLTDRLDTHCIDPTDAPPIISARIEYQVFGENVDELDDQMLPEIEAAMKEWLDLFADTPDDKQFFRDMILKRIGSYKKILAMKGLEAFIDRADRLKAVDDVWRLEHPELSTKFPPD